MRNQGINTKKIIKFLENLATFFILLVGLFLILVVFSPKLGYKIVIIQSGSMEPVIKTGGMVLIKKSNTYNKGDIITFIKNRKETITHRIVYSLKNNRGEITYKTKGDNNNTEDLGLVPKQNVLGKVLLTIPYIGWGIQFLKTRTGATILIIIPAICFIILEIIKIRKEIKRMKTKNLENKNTKSSGNNIKRYIIK